MLKTISLQNCNLTPLQAAVILAATYTTANPAATYEKNISLLTQGSTNLTNGLTAIGAIFATSFAETLTKIFTFKWVTN
jgi:hypothetical protein